MTMLNVAADTLGARLRVSRLAAGLERRDLAERIGVSVDTIGNWERGKFEPSVSQFIEWAHATAQPVDRLIDGLQMRARRDSNSQPSDLVSARGEGCPCQVLEYHDRCDCPFGCSCGWCAPDLHSTFWSIVERIEVG